jgi:hypothetical protein
VQTIEGVSMPHIMEIMGKTRVVVKDGEVIEKKKLSEKC